MEALKFTLQGDAAAPEQFAELYNPVVQEWQSATSKPGQQSLLTAVHPLTNEVVRVDVSCYADDVARTCIASDPHELVRTEACWDSSLDDSLAAIGMGQNHGKKEWLLRFVGKRACVKMRQSLGVRSKLVSKPKLVARCLGAWEDADGCFQMDVSKRICAAQTAWHSMLGWFKSRSAPLMSRIAVFKNLVLGSLLTGLEASVLTDTDYSRLEKTQMKWLRAIMGRCAFVSLTSGVSPVSESEARVYHARSNQEVRELTRGFTIRSGLLYRRLRWLQQIAAQPQDHKLLLAVVAGRLATQSDNAFDERGTPTFAARPWAHQWFTDLCSLEEVSAKAILNQRGFWSIFEHDSIFHKVDVSVVRVCFDRGVEHAEGPVTKHACPHISRREPVHV